MDFAQPGDTFILICPTCHELNFDPKVCISCGAAIPLCTRMKLLRGNKEVEVTGFNKTYFPQATYSPLAEASSSRFKPKVESYHSPKIQSYSKHSHSRTCACVKYLKTEAEVWASFSSAKEDEYTEILSEDDERNVASPSLNIQLESNMELDVLCQSFENLTPHSPSPNNSAKKQKIAVETPPCTMASSYATSTLAWADKNCNEISKEIPIKLPTTCNKRIDHIDNRLSLEILSESTDELNIHKNGNISGLSNKTSNGSIELNVLNDLKQPTKLDMKLSVLSKDKINSEKEMESDKHCTKISENLVNISLNSVNSDILKESTPFSEDADSGIKGMKKIPVESFVSEKSTKIDVKSPDIKICDVSQVDPEKPKSLLRSNKDKIDNETDALKLQENSRKGRSKTTSQIRDITSSSDYKFRKSTIDSSSKGALLQENEMASTLSLKAQSLGRKKTSKVSVHPSDVEMESVEDSAIHNIKEAPSEVKKKSTISMRGRPGKKRKILQFKTGSQLEENIHLSDVVKQSVEIPTINSTKGVSSQIEEIKKTVCNASSKNNESAKLSDVEMENAEISEKQSSEVMTTTTYQTGDIPLKDDSKIVEHSDIKPDLQNIKMHANKNIDCQPIAEFKFSQELSCIRINSKFTFFTKGQTNISVSFQSDGICLELPKFKASSRTLTAMLSESDIEHILVYCDTFSNAFISIITSSDQGIHLKEDLRMYKKASPYYNPDVASNQLKISFLINDVTDDIITFLYRKFGKKKVYNIDQKAAFAMLTSLSPVTNSPPLSSAISLVYPAVGGIEVQDQDINTLASKGLLNDTIIEFYLKYIYYEMIPDDFQARTHIFSPFFYLILRQVFDLKKAGKKESDDMERVNKWIKNVDMFSKDFIFIPINKGRHWYLVVICFLTQLCEKSLSGGEIGVEYIPPKAESKESSENCPPDDDTPKTRRKDKHPYLVKGRPCICFFDSLDRQSSIGREKTKVAETLKEFLEMLWKVKNPTESCDWKKLLFLKAVCPQQRNDFDCGLYLLQYVESFFEKPIPYFGDPMPDLKNWFRPEVIIHKRAKIKNVISELKEKQPKTFQFQPSCSSDITDLS